MSIKKRLLLSNLGMIIIPIISFFVIEIILGYILFVVYHGKPEGSDLQLFINLRFFAFIIILIVTNGLLTYFVSKSILIPIRNLSEAAKRISDGELDFEIKATSQDELGQLANTFDKMRLSLKEAQETQAHYEQNRKELIASISHDLKTPLTSIKGYVKGIQDGVARSPEQLERYLNTIGKKAEHMDSLIDELFLYSKLDLEQVPFHFEAIDLYTFFQDFIEELNFHFDGSTIFQANKADFYIVQADREQLKRVVTNIIQNSLKYMDKEHKEIRVHLLAQEDEVKVEITDNGSGIPEADLSNIFQDFYRTDASRNSATGGSGLGLAIVRKIINRFGGKIWAESVLGEGTSIYFTLKKVN